MNAPVGVREMKGFLKSPHQYSTSFSIFPQDLVAFVHQQAEMLEKKSATIDKQSTLITQLQEETGVSLYYLTFSISKFTPAENCYYLIFTSKCT